MFASIDPIIRRSIEASRIGHSMVSFRWMLRERLLHAGNSWKSALRFLVPGGDNSCSQEGNLTFGIQASKTLMVFKKHHSDKYGRWPTSASHDYINFWLTGMR